MKAKASNLLQFAAERALQHTWENVTDEADAVPVENPDKADGVASPLCFWFRQPGSALAVGQADGEAIRRRHDRFLC
jgi:hypothetical protein